MKVEFYRHPELKEKILDENGKWTREYSEKGLLMFHLVKEGHGSNTPFDFDGPAEPQHILTYPMAYNAFIKSEQEPVVEEMKDDEGNVIAQNPVEDSSRVELTREVKEGDKSLTVEEKAGLIQETEGNLSKAQSDQIAPPVPPVEEEKDASKSEEENPVRSDSELEALNKDSKAQ